MTGFTYRSAQLWCERVPVAKVAQALGTPLFLYSRDAVLAQYGALREAFAGADTLICYSVKANGNLGILRLLAAAGSGFDVVSGGELFRALKAGAEPAKIVFAGVGKTRDEIGYSLESGILFFNVESGSELDLIAKVARELGKRARIAFRLNPDVDPHTHAHITTGKSDNKFGLDAEAILALVKRYARSKDVEIAGLHMHIGSQITEIEPHGLAVKRMLALVKRIEALGPRLEYVNVGGGYGISYEGKEVPPFAAFAAQILPPLQGSGRKLVLEPGRSIVGNAGILLTRVVHVKETAAGKESASARANPGASAGASGRSAASASPGKKFVICDAAMNDLIRPVLYNAYHEIWPVNGSAPPLLGGEESAALGVVDIVGPICESGDCFARDRRLPQVAAGDLLAVYSAGAYGMAMSSNYNSRPRAAEALVEGSTWRVIRAREKYEDLIRAEDMDSEQAPSQEREP